LCKLGGGGGVWDLYPGTVQDQLFLEALFVKKEIRVTMVKFPLQVLEFVDGALTGLDNL